MNPIKVALYCRVSTEEQAINGSSLRSQLDALKKYAKSNGYGIYDDYIDDGYSGATLDRPALNRLRVDAKDGKFKVVLAYKTDRFSRSLPQVVSLVLEEFDKLGVSFKSITETFETETPAGRMLFGNLAMFADFERSQIRERNTRGKRTKAKEGKVVQNWMPFGYKRNPDRSWGIDEEQAKVYKMMVKWYVKDGLSTKQVARKLTSMGIPTVRSDSNRWGPTSVKRIFKHRTHTGSASYDGVTFKVPPLITESEWNQLQQEMVNRRSTRNQKVVHFYLLRNLLKCSCGKSLFGEHRDAKHAANYRCLSGKTIYSQNCGLPNLRMEKADDWVWSRVLGFIKSPETIRKMIEGKKTHGNVSEVTYEAELTAVQKNIAKKKSEIERLYKLYASGTIESTDELNTVLTNAKEELSTLEKEQAFLNRKVAHQQKMKDNVKEVENTFRNFQDKIHTLTPEQKREILLKLIDKVVVSYNLERDGGRHALKVVFKFEIPAMVMASVPVLS